MKILFLCTAHNSLSQRLFLALSTSHDVIIEYALSDDLMISATELANPDLIICPFLTARVPKAIYDKFMTLIIHPGPPGDAGPSALDWLLMGDDGSVEDAGKLLQNLAGDICRPGRTHWGVTVFQAIEEFDAGPVWAFEQFAVDIDQPGLTKSALYRGSVSRAAVSAAVVAINRIQKAATDSQSLLRAAGTKHHGCISTGLRPLPDYKLLSVEAKLPFRGGKTLDRPLLKAAQREFDVNRHSAQQISRFIRCGDSQPGSLSKVFGMNLYVYGGIVEGNPDGPNPGAVPGAAPGTIVATRNEAVCIATCDGRGVWITHVRRLKRAKDLALWPKVPAATELSELGILTADQICRLAWDLPNDWSISPFPTLQDVSVDFASYGESKQAAYLYFDFYNGAMATNQCSRLIDAMDYILSNSSSSHPIQAVVLMGGAYFSNGIALNVIEHSSDPSLESWRNINRIDDVVHYLLHEFPSRNIRTIAGVRGSAAAGGCALAAACDIVITGSEVVLNPAYRGIGLHGSEYHSLSYFGRCGSQKATEILQSMTPMSPFEARSIGLVDHVLPGTGDLLDRRIRSHVAVVVKSGKPGCTLWKSKMDLSPSTLAHARTMELNEMSKDFYSARSMRYHSRRFNFVRKVKASRTPLRFATHRRLDENHLDEEECKSFDNVEHFETLRYEQFMMQRLNHLATDGSSLNSAQALQPKLFQVKKQVENIFPCYYPPVGDQPTPPLTSSSQSSSLYLPLASNDLSG
jgi:enoyl-CoA hydratase/carnithine racemase/methionyl-tRNA formyltransferase